MVAAVIAGAEGWEDIEYFGEDNLEWLQQYGDQGKITYIFMFKGFALW